jgi:hypothetical protein
MATLLADFKSDLLIMAREYLEKQWGPEHIDNDRVLVLYFDSLRRRPAVRKRRVWEADDFYCPPELASGWELLRTKVVNGDDIGPHQGREHASLSELDGLLNEWGVHHLHLGTKPYFKDNRYIDRSLPLLFALITNDDFYAINIYAHGGWESMSVIESLHRNWPQIINRYRIKGIQGEPLTKEERRGLRDKNILAATTLSDGTVYMAIGGGVASSGVSVEAVRRADRAWDEMERLQVFVQDGLGDFVVHLRPRGYTDGQDIRARLVGITPEGCQVLFPDFGVLAANVKIERDSLYIVSTGYAAE